MPRVLLLLPTTTYRTKAFMEAASRLGVEIVAASEVPSTMQALNPAGLMTLNFLDPEIAARDSAAFAREHRIDAVIPVDEDTAVAAAQIAAELQLSNNSVASAVTAKDKYRMRSALKEAGVRVPRFWHFTLEDDLIAQASEIEYPCVVKPVFLSTSRGVMRVDNEEQFIGAIHRLKLILEMKDVARRGGPAVREVLAEKFVPGLEIAVEGLLTEGRLRILAIFDKPDPLDGPFFEETIYVTPSRLSDEIQLRVASTTEAAARAMGLERGPVHAELRINDDGVWVIEVAARAIGGLCSRALRFEPGDSSLEELIIRHALGEVVDGIERESQAAGVMMIPIPRAGVLREVEGLDEARQSPNIEDIVITAHLGQAISPPPEGSSYLGFIFSRAESASIAEEALREAHKRIEFIIE
jgi:biotin carboxylase